MVNFVAKVIANGQHVQGESMESAFEGWIEVLAYDWGGGAQLTHGGAGRQGRVTYANLVLRKRRMPHRPSCSRRWTTTSSARSLFSFARPARAANSRTT